MLFFCRYLDIFYEQEAEYTITVDAFNTVSLESSTVTVQVETLIEDLAVNFIPALSAGEPSSIHLQFQENFIKGNVMIDFNDGTVYKSFYQFNSQSPSATIEHRYKTLLSFVLFATIP